MTQTANDHPRVVVFPPVILLATIALAVLLQWLAPIRLWAGFDPAWRIALGTALVIACMIMCAVAQITLVHRGTNILPTKPTTALATGGIYRFSRNPIYVGGLFGMIGIALAFNIVWLLPLLVPSLLALHFGVIRREEQYLEAKFGDEYRRYCARAPRYLVAV
jgi:protein-S-isoprenylcysteine O-methyltransferase Ste14